MQMRMVKLSQIGFGYFSCNPQKHRKEKISPCHKEYVRMKAGRLARAGTRLSAREQLRACVKWDLVDLDFFIFSNFVR